MSDACCNHCEPPPTGARVRGWFTAVAAVLALVGCGIGIVVDFFGLAAKNSGFPTDFVYPSVTAIVPANIGVIAGAKNPEAAKRFMQFALSEEGQELLLSPKISRLPVLPAAYVTPWLRTRTGVWLEPEWQRWVVWGPVAIALLSGPCAALLRGRAASTVRLQRRAAGALESRGEDRREDLA